MDPSVLFVGACVLSPPFLAAHHAQGNMWHEARRYFGHPLVAAALGVTLLLAAWGARVGARYVRPGGRFPSQPSVCTPNRKQNVDLHFHPIGSLVHISGF